MARCRLYNNLRQRWPRSVALYDITRSGPPTPGVQPLYPRPFFSSLSTTHIFLFFRVPPPKIQIFRPRPSHPAPAHFSSKAALPPLSNPWAPAPPFLPHSKGLITQQMVTLSTYPDFLSDSFPGVPGHLGFSIIPMPGVIQMGPMTSELNEKLDFHDASRRCRWCHFVVLCVPNISSGDFMSYNFPTSPVGFLENADESRRLVKSLDRDEIADADADAETVKDADADADQCKHSQWNATGL